MRNPQQKIFLYAALLLVGVALAGYGLRTDLSKSADWVAACALGIGVLTIAIGAIQLILALLHTRGRGQLLAGRNVLARWHLTAEEWNRFLAFDRIRSATDPSFSNDLSLGEGRQDRGVDVIVGRKSALIGDSYHPLRKGAIPGTFALYWLPAPADPECLEFHASYPRRHGLARKIAIRFPFPPAARGDAIRVFEHFEPLLRVRPALALRNPRRTVQICLAAALAFALLAGWGLQRTRFDLSDETGAVIAVIVGAVAASTALFIALVTLLLSRRRKT